MKTCFLRTLVALLALCMCAVLPGCNNGPDPAETPGLDLTAYTIIRSDATTSSDMETKLCVKLAAAIKAVSGAKAQIDTDYEDQEGQYADRPEILVGMTNRPESIAMKEQLKNKNDYIIRATDKKIVILANHESALEEAMTVFLSNYVGYRSETDFDAKEALMIEPTLSLTGTWIDPEEVPDDGKPDVLYGLSQDQVDEYFADILGGLFTGDTQETIAMKDMGASFKMHFPDMIYKDGQYWAYYITYKTNSGKGGVGLAVSDDGKTWKDQGCVLQPGEDYDCNGAYFAGVWLDDDGTYYLTYECKGGEETEYGTLENVALATSQDGINWEKEGIILYKNPEIAWQTANVGTPDLYKKDGVWYLFFHGFDFIDCQVGVAYGEDLHNLTVVPEPIIPTVDDTPYSGTVGRRDVIYVGGYYYMVYEVSTDQAEGGGYNGAYWTHMFARSKDLINWETIEAPIITQTNADGSQKPGFGYDGPCWMIIGKHIYVYVRISNKTTAFELTLLK